MTLVLLFSLVFELVEPQHVKQQIKHTCLLLTKPPATIAVIGSVTIDISYALHHGRVDIHAELCWILL